MSSTDPPVKVGFADGVYVFRVSAMKQLFLQHITPVVLHLILLPLLNNEITVHLLMCVIKSVY